MKFLKIYINQATKSENHGIYFIYSMSKLRTPTKSGNKIKI